MARSAGERKMKSGNMKKMGERTKEIWAGAYTHADENIIKRTQGKKLA